MSQTKAQLAKWRTEHRYELRSAGRASYWKDPQGNVRNQLAWRKSHPVSAARNHLRGYLKHFYGLTLERYHEMLGEQNGLCANPGCRMTNDGKRLAIDHKHTPGYSSLPAAEKAKNVRGLLCTNCNVAIGNFHEKHEAMSGASEYLLRYA